MAEAGELRWVEPTTRSTVMEPPDAAWQTEAGERRPQGDAAENQDIEQMREAHRRVPVLDGGPIFREEMFLAQLSSYDDQLSSWGGNFVRGQSRGTGQGRRSRR